MISFLGTEGSVKFFDGSKQSKNTSDLCNYTPGSRLSFGVNTEYVNTTGKIMHVSVTGTPSASGTYYSIAYVNGAQVAYFFASNGAGAWAAYGWMSFFVPPGATYQVTNAGGGVNVYSISFQY